MKNKLELKLYINGMTAAARAALENLEEVCQKCHGHDYIIEVIDIREHPQQAEEEKIIATPTLIRKNPPPVSRVIGDLSERSQLMLGLDFESLREFQ